MISPEEFTARCRVIVTSMRGHEAHRALDFLSNEVLAGLGYGDGVAIFEAAVKGWHNDAHPYPRSYLGHYWATGHRNGLAKLNDDKVREIRASRESDAALAARMNVTPEAIRLARHGITWRHVT